jgi:hypothetical protein
VGGHHIGGFRLRRGARPRQTGKERAAARTERAAQRLVRAAATSPLPTGRVRFAAGGSAAGGPATGSAGGGPAAGGMSAAANFAGFAELLHAHLNHHAMPADEGTAFIVDSRTYLPVLGVSPFGQGPGDMAAFIAIYEIIRKINRILLVGCYCGPQEDLGTMNSQCVYRGHRQDCAYGSRG